MYVACITRKRFLLLIRRASLSESTSQKIDLPRQEEKKEKAFKFKFLSLQYLTDVNECTDARRCPADKECINTEGSYRCRVKCSQGYERVQLSDDCRGERTCLKY